MIHRLPLGCCCCSYPPSPLSSLAGQTFVACGWERISSHFSQILWTSAELCWQHQSDV